jgi:hypothetical protein
MDLNTRQYDLYRKLFEHMYYDIIYTIKILHNK